MNRGDRANIDARQVNGGTRAESVNMLEMHRQVTVAAQQSHAATEREDRCCQDSYPDYHDDPYSQRIIIFLFRHDSPSNRAKSERVPQKLLHQLVAGAMHFLGIA